MAWFHMGFQAAFSVSRCGIVGPRFLSTVTRFIRVAAGWRRCRPHGRRWGAGAGACAARARQGAANAQLETHSIAAARRPHRVVAGQAVHYHCGALLHCGACGDARRPAARAGQTTMPGSASSQPSSMHCTSSSTPARTCSPTGHSCPAFTSRPGEETRGGSCCCHVPVLCRRPVIRPDGEELVQGQQWAACRCTHPHAVHSKA